MPDDVAAGLAVNDDALAAVRAMAKPEVLPVAVTAAEAGEPDRYASVT